MEFMAALNVMFTPANCNQPDNPYVAAMAMTVNNKT